MEDALENNGSPEKDCDLDLDDREAIKKLTGLLPTEFHQRLAKLDWRDQSLEDSKATVSACLPGIMLAGAVFPTVVVCWATFLAFFDGFVLQRDLWLVVGIMAMCVVVGSFVGFFVAAIGTIASWMVVPTFNSWLGCPLDARRLVAVTGGFAGYACTAFPLVFENEIRTIPFSYYYVVGVAVLTGQTGAVWYASKPGSWVDTLHSHEFGLRGRSQFQLKQMFIVTALFALVLGLDRAIEFHFSLLLLVYVGWMTVTLAMDAVWQIVQRLRSKPATTESN